MVGIHKSLIFSGLVLCALCTLLTPTTIAQSTSSDVLYAGTAKVDITPDETFIVPEGGCAFRLPDDADRDKTPPKNVLDPIDARVVVIKNGDTSLAIVSLDLVLFGSKKVIDQAKEKWGVDHVILSSTHTHSSMVPRNLCPTPKGWAAWENIQEEASELLDWPGFSEDPWYAATEERIVAAIGQAMENLFPARIAAVRAPYKSIFLGHNRRRVNPDGTVTMMWDNPNRIPSSPLDSTIGVIRIDDTSGKPRAFMVHYACHPVSLMNSGELTRDFPGPTVDYIEQKLGPDCMAMFLQGACGDLDPYEYHLKDAYGHNFIKQAGTALGKAALRAARNLKPSQDSIGPAIAIKEDMVTIPYRTKDKVTEACVMTVVINKDFALMTMPGEPFVRQQLDLTQKSPLANAFLLGFAYCGAGSPWLRYIPDAQSASEGGFGADVNWYTFIAADGGERMVDRAVSSIREMLAPPKISPEEGIKVMRKLSNEDKHQDLVNQFKDQDLATWPNAATAFHYRGYAYLHVKDIVNAEKDLKEATKRSPENGYFWYNLAEAYEKLGRDDATILDAYNKAVDSVFADEGGKSYGWMPVSATLRSASILMHQTKYAEALHSMERYNQDDTPKMGVYWGRRTLRMYGHIYAAMGEEEKCMAYFRAALELDEK